MDPGPIYGFGPVGTNGPKPVPPKPPRPACPRYIRRRAKRHEVAADYLATHAKPDSRVPGTLTLHASTNRPTRAERKARDRAIAEDMQRRQKADALNRENDRDVATEQRAADKARRDRRAAQSRAAQLAGLGHLKLADAQAAVF